MQIVINFNDIELSDWIEYDPEIEQVTLTDIFKGEILNKFVEKVNYDGQIRQYIKEQINEGLWSKIYDFKDDAAIEVIAKQCIEEKLKQTGSFIFLNDYAAKVEGVVEKYLKKYPNKIEQAVQSSVRCQIEKCLDELYKGSKMREFIDIEKLSAHIHKVLSEKTEGEG